MALARLARRSLCAQAVSASRLLAALVAASLAAPSGADDAAGRPPTRIARMPRGIDVSPADRELYAMVTEQPAAARAGAAAPRLRARSAGPTLGASGDPLPGPVDDGSCALLRAGSAATSTQECLRCHARGSHGSHPVDLDYDRFAGGRGELLRSAAEVVRRGLLLPDGRLHCVTCHDGMARWKHHLAVPPGSEIRLAVDRRDPATFDGKGTPWGARATLPPGTDVARRALCTACHAMD
jgi:hypothetical protein